MKTRNSIDEVDDEKMVISIARAIYDAMAGADKFPPTAYIGSADELRDVPIDGVFDLYVIARAVLRLLYLPASH
ncbi:MAG: hypothetical protein E6K47_07765 [Gammaproteobacteria bacterium]|nr:MAG: hypothetical protein E6K47_07765 [Gammaproteobacteria bacterium]